MHPQQLLRSLKGLHTDLYIFHAENLQMLSSGMTNELSQSWFQSMNALRSANLALGKAIDAERTAEAACFFMEPAAADLLRERDDGASVRAVALVGQAHHAALAAAAAIDQALGVALTAANAASQVSKAAASLSPQPGIAALLQSLTAPLDEINAGYAQQVAQPSPAEARQDVNEGAAPGEESAARAQEETVSAGEPPPFDEVAPRPISASVRGDGAVVAHEDFQMASPAESARADNPQVDSGADPGSAAADGVPVSHLAGWATCVIAENYFSAERGLGDLQDQGASTYSGDGMAVRADANDGKIPAGMAVSVHLGQPAILEHAGGGMGLVSLAGVVSYANAATGGSLGVSDGYFP